MQKDRAARALDPLGINQISSPLILLLKGTLIGPENDSVLLYINHNVYFFFFTILYSVNCYMSIWDLLCWTWKNSPVTGCYVIRASDHITWFSSADGVCPVVMDLQMFMFFMYLFISTFVDDDHAFQVSRFQSKSTHHAKYFECVEIYHSLLFTY